MLPKSFFQTTENFRQGEIHHVFVLLPSNLKDRYNDRIKPAIEQITSRNRSLTCVSYLDFSMGSHAVEEIWKNIKDAGIILADITGFSPSVMYELGFVGPLKEDVFIMLEKDEDNNLDRLPFNISQINAFYYDPNKEDELENGVTRFINEKIDERDDDYGNYGINDSDVDAILKQIIDKRSSDAQFALMLFDNIKFKMPELNWYIYLQWGITHKYHKSYDDAYTKFQEALNLTNQRWAKSAIYVELAKLYALNEYPQRNQNKVQEYFERAADLYKRTPNLYMDWAKTFAEVKQYKAAYDKAFIGYTENPSEENKILVEFYSDLALGKVVTREVHVKRSRRKTTYKDSFSKKNNRKNRLRPDKKRLSRKDKQAAYHKTKEKYDIGSYTHGTMVNLEMNIGLFIKLETGFTGLAWIGDLPPDMDEDGGYKKGKKVRVRIIGYDDRKLKVDLAIADEKLIS